MLGGKFNLGSLMKGAKKIQEIAAQNQAELAKLEVTGEAGAGLVALTMTGQYIVKDIQLSDELLNESKEVIQELIAAAINNATQKVQETSRDKMSDMTQLFGELNGDDK